MKMSALFSSICVTRIRAHANAHFRNNKRETINIPNKFGGIEFRKRQDWLRISMGELGKQLDISFPMLTLIYAL